MFDRVERQLLPHADVYGAAQRIHEAVFREGQVVLNQIGPTSWMGKGTESGLGTAPKVALFAVPYGNGFALDLRISAELEDKGIIFLGVGWFVCFPVAAILFFFAWREFTEKQRALFQSAWGAALGGGGHPQLPNAFR